MIVVFKLKTLLLKALMLVIGTLLITLIIIFSGVMGNENNINVSSQEFIKWVDFNIPTTAMERALKYDIESYGKDIKLNWIELLAYLGTKYGGNYSAYKSKDLDNLVEKINSGDTIPDLTSKMKHYDYYYEAYSAVLSGFVGEYRTEVKKSKDSDEKVWQSKYGLKAFSPIANGYGFSHYDDFGDQRSYGFKRRHLGNDLMGAIGTPIIAVESGYVEALGWDEFGGWRIGIRSFDKKRYYYYAHLRKYYPYHGDLYKGKSVKAGDVIGYMGMTGYSTKENVNNIKIPHLHFGMQLIFDESQKEGANEIWINVYNIIELLRKNSVTVYKDSETMDFYRTFDIEVPEVRETVN
jgi:murein DD-endopeptidase MepM/ murein hydrolase activator NlpD